MSWAALPLLLLRWLKMSQTKIPASVALWRQLLAALSALALVSWSSAGRVRASLRDAIKAPRSLLTRGSALSSAVLLQQARRRDPNVTLDELSATRLIASELGSGSPQEWAVIVDAELNRAEKKGKTLTDHLTGGTGMYGPQGGIRSAATRRNGSLQHLAAARAVLSGDARGISRGAVRFFDPRAQDKLHRRFKRGKTGDRVFSCQALGTLKAWAFDLPQCKAGRRCCADGLPTVAAKPGRNPQEWIGPVPGVDAFRLMAFRDAELGDSHSASHAAAAAVIRKRQGLPALLDDPMIQVGALVALAVLL